GCPYSSSVRAFSAYSSDRDTPAPPATASSIAAIRGWWATVASRNASPAAARPTSSSPAWSANRRRYAARFAWICSLAAAPYASPHSAGVPRTDTSGRSMRLTLASPRRYPNRDLQIGARVGGTRYGGVVVVDDSCVLIDGPWTHRFVNANGSRFHVVEAGTGPMVMFLHGFPEFWWAWHKVLPLVAEAGYRAVAVDLRGYGASDKPPRGYDGYTMAADATGLIRALGERSAVLVGAGYGGMMAWTAAAFHPKLVRRLVVTGAAHPLRMRAAVVADPR